MEDRYPLDEYQKTGIEGVFFQAELGEKLPATLIVELTGVGRFQKIKRFLEGLIGLFNLRDHWRKRRVIIHQDILEDLEKMIVFQLKNYCRLPKRINDGLNINVSLLEKALACLYHIKDNLKPFDNEDFDSKHYKFYRFRHTYEMLMFFQLLEESTQFYFDFMNMSDEWPVPPSRCKFLHRLVEEYCDGCGYIDDQQDLDEDPIELWKNIKPNANPKINNKYDHEVKRIKLARKEY